MKKILSALVVICLTFSSVFGQGEIQDAELIIEKNTEIKLSKKDRIFLPIAEPDLSYNYSIDFSVTSPVLKVPAFLPQPSDQYRPSTTTNTIYDHLFVGSFGTLISPYLLYSYENSESEDYQFGGLLNIDSYSRGAVRDEESGIFTSQVKLHGQKDLRTLTVGSSLNYQLQRYGYYGLPDSLLSVDNAVFLRERVALNRFNLDVSVKSNNEEGINYIVRPYYQFSGMSEVTSISSENLAGIEFNMGQFTDDGIGYGFEADISSATYSSGPKSTRSFIDVLPSVSFSKRQFSVKGGVRLLYFGGDNASLSTSFYILPEIETNFQFDNIRFFASLKPEYNTNTLGSLTIDNMWLNDSLTLGVSVSPLSASLGASGSIFPGLSYRAAFNFRSWDQLGQFVFNAEDPSRFDMLYSSLFSGKNVVQTSFLVDLDWMLNRNSNFGLFLKYHNYDTRGGLESVVHLPAFESGVYAEWAFTNNFLLEFRLAQLGGIKSYNIDNQYFTNISSIIDLSFSLSYFLNQQVSVFLSGGNLLNRDNERFVNYAVRPFSIQLGVIARF